MPGMLADGAAVAAGGHPGRPADTVAARVEETVEGPALWPHPAPSARGRRGQAREGVALTAYRARRAGAWASLCG